MRVPALAQAVLWMVGALLSFSAIALGIRSLGGAFTTFEILSLRTGGGLIAMLAVGAMRPHLFRTFTTRRIGLHALRNGLNLSAQYLWTASITLLPLATVFALEFTTPAWTALLSVAAMGAGFAFALGSVVWDTTLQRKIAPEKLARVASYGWMGAMVFLPAGYALAGPIGMAIGVKTYLLIAAGWIVLSTLVVIRLRAVRDVSLDDVTDAVPAPAQ